MATSTTSSGTTITVKQGTTYTYYTISGNNRTALLAGSSSTYKTSEYFATESSTLVEVEVASVTASQDIIMLSQAEATL